MGAKKGGIGAWMAKPLGRKVMGYAFGIGAAVVILGALFKIMHWPGCNEMLIAGLGTEAVLFTLSSFQITHPEPDWSVYYPYAYPENERHRGYDEKGGNVVKWDSDDVNPLAISGGGSGAGQDYGAKIDAMMEKAGVNQALFDKLGNGIAQLHTTAESLKGVANAAGASDAYVNALNDAAANISKLSDSYEAASKNVAGLTVDGTGVQDFGMQITTENKDKYKN
ncbi:MAG: gliding motility protein GldL, partial [Flavobacteriia bacterium]|nr:gliding motility protein GldL [Flavobacteriia bacterium]